MQNITCDYCGAAHSTLVFRSQDTNYHFDGTFNIVRCDSCRLVYLNPRPSPETIGDYYPDVDYTCFASDDLGGAALSESARLSPQNPFVRVWKRRKMPPGRLLEIGCGVGNFLISAQNSGWQVSGVEPNAFARGKCNEYLGQEVVKTTLEDAEFSDEYFDAVALWHVLEHVPSPAATLTGIYRVLKPAGMFALAVPNFDSLERRIWKERWIAIDSPRHLYHFTPSTLRMYLVRFGFDLLEFHYQSAANSLGANILRTTRLLFLDPFHPPASRSLGLSVNRTQVSTSKANQTKERLQRLVPTLVLPIAWLIAHAGLGPEIMAFARKSQKVPR